MNDIPERVTSQKLRDGKYSILEEFCCILVSEDLQKLNTYVEELVYNPQVAASQVQKILLLYVAAIQFVVLSFDEEQYLTEDLVKNCNALAKSLFVFYHDLNTILYTKQIEHLWKLYIKLTETVKRIPLSSSGKTRANRARVLLELHRVGSRIKGF